VQIDPKFENLLLQMRIAKVDDHYGLVKKFPNRMDLVEALRLALLGFQII
jgi:hypothetical protein